VLCLGWKRSKLTDGEILALTELLSQRILRMRSSGCNGSESEDDSAEDGGGLHDDGSGVIKGVVVGLL
jgi:hypothetical protein